MKKLKKWLLILLVILFAAVLGILIYVIVTAPKLPENANKIITKILESPLQEMVTGKTGIAENDGVRTWYEVRSPQDSSRGVILLIMGIGNDAMAWPDYFVNSLVGSGFTTIKYDHRGMGMSDWLKDWNAKDPYSLKDMALDGLAILDTLGIQKAHVLGVSMGGMIAQTMAINFPESVSSLTLLMTSGHIEDPELPAMPMSMITGFIKLYVKYGIINTERSALKLQMAARQMLNPEPLGDDYMEMAARQTLYNIRKRRGLNNKVIPQHSAAVRATGSQLESIKSLSMPVLIVHGKQDPLIPIAHGHKLAERIPNNRSLWIDNMGHDVLPEKSEIIVKAFIDNYSFLAGIE